MSGNRRHHKALNMDIIDRAKRLLSDAEQGDTVEIDWDKVKLGGFMFIAGILLGIVVR